MQLTAVLPRADLDELLNDLLPLKVLLGADRDDRTLLLYDPSSVSFVAGHGIGLSCKADIRWSVLGITVPIQLRALTVMLVPRVSQRDGVPALVLDLALEHVDLAGVPAALEGRLVDLINQALQARQVELAWGFGKTLSHAFALPAMLESVSSFNLGVGESSVDVLADALRLDIQLRAGVSRR
jgi:hypothetical protein